MHLLEILRARSVPGAGIFLCLTRQCPLSCAHCSTNSSINNTTSISNIDVLRFVRTFRESIAPSIVALTGGEPLMRPFLVRDIAEIAKESGVHSYVISGMFFAREPRIPVHIEAALRSISHLSASIDQFHETQVPRSTVFEALAKIRDLGVSVSIQTVAVEESDPYVDLLADEVREFFHDQVPMLVATLKPHGRAEEFYIESSGKDNRFGPSPCRFSSWPVVNENGIIVACCNQKVVDGPAPEHLSIGTLPQLTWGEVRSKVLESRILRELRTRGPCALALTANEQVTGFCESCLSLGKHHDKFDQRPNLKDRLSELVVADMIAEEFIPTHQSYRHLAMLGSKIEVL